jgi:AmmeMemoRadiSam system protein B
VDIQKGWPLYGAAYRLLRNRMPDLDRILVLGTGHTMKDGLLCPTSKHTLTPLGRASTDLDFVKGLRGPDGDGGRDFPHRGEHSIEFQVIFLQHVYAEQLAPLVPVLCGSVEAHLGSAHRPSDLPGVGGALERMRDALADRSLAVAGVDLSHVGPKFGDGEPSSSILPDALEHETALIDALERADVEAFWSEARRVSDRHHVCGLTALGFLLEILPPGARGVLLGRDVMREHDTSSAVGFASLAFFA